MIDDDLLRVLAAHAGRQQAYSTPPAPMSGGFWASIYTFELQNPPADLAGPLVLRVMPSRDAGVRETVVQRTVAEQGYSTPRVVLDGVDERLGGAFMVMCRVTGAGLLDGVNLGRILLQLPKTSRRLSHELSRASLELHALDTTPVVEALDRAGIDAHSLGVRAHLGAIEDAARHGLAGFAKLHEWLTSRRPVMTPEVVCHGDIHPFNVLVDDDGDFNLLDWTGACLCRREYDVGCTAALLNCAPVAVPRIASRPLGAITALLAKRFIDAYRRSAVINLDVVEWFETLQYGRCLAAVAMAPIINDGIVGPRHPFRIAGPSMSRQVQLITDAQIEVAPIEVAAG